MGEQKKEEERKDLTYYIKCGDAKRLRLKYSKSNQSNGSRPTTKWFPFNDGQKKTYLDHMCRRHKGLKRQ
jgi:hypothetical protein